MEYRSLTLQSQSDGVYALVPIRLEDREVIRKWRNEQMYHLRQNSPLSEAQQDHYFETVVQALFEQEKPNQYLFSYLMDGQCIGYGGLVHIDHQKKKGELSFIMATHLEAEHFDFHWKKYLKFIETIAFDGLGLNKIYTYAYDLRPHLYPVLESMGFSLEQRIERALEDNGVFTSARIHSKWNGKLRRADAGDLDLSYSWANAPEVRAFAFQKEHIDYETHKAWFGNKIKDENCLYFIYESKGQALGSMRMDLTEDGGLISYLLAPKYHGFGWGTALLLMGEKEAREMRIQQIFGYVLAENKASCAIFDKLSYQAEVQSDRIKYHKILF